MLKNDIVDWLINNDSLTMEIIAETNSRLLGDALIFREEAQGQWYEEIKRQLINEMSKTIGLTPEMFHVTISNKGFESYIQEVLKAYE